MASSSSKPRTTYHVFLSFRGPDVCNHFLGHLYTALDQAGIHTYKDDEELRKGEQIPHALMNAIEDSQIAIIIFSEDYASSSWCLEELTKIMECRKQKDLIVWPVFYKVEPCEVRMPRESYKKALAKHEVKFGKDSEKVNRWKKALFYASFLSGWHFTDGYEAAFIQQIVQKISTQLDQTPSDVAKYLVGIESQVQELKSILNLQANDDVLMVGLWGQGGVGKTTLTKAIYNAIFREFQGSSFLERIREKSQSSHDVVSLQEKLLSEVGAKELTISTVGKGSQLIQERLCNKKVLIVFDDVDDEDQLNALAGDCEWFGKGSRIIITTRNKHMLTSYNVDSDHMYEVKALKDGEALELFRRHAFMRNHQIEIRSNLVDSVLHYAKGLPLALQVLGSSLCGKGEKEWEETLEKLAESPNQKIDGVLRVSYDGLENNEKEIFLDIACFFKGEDTEYIKKVLNSFDFYTNIGLRILIERSLISEEKGILQMHDLLQSMGMDIVKEECRDDLEKCSRLWLRDDVLDVISRNGGTNATKAIVLKLPMSKKMHIGPDAFAKMSKLRLLVLHNVDISFQGPINVSNELRWFEWPRRASFPKFRDGSKKSVGLEMPDSNIVVGLEQFKVFTNLKFLDFSECLLVVSMPDLDLTPNLEELDLHGCKNLKRAHESVAYHAKLRLLNLKGCSNLYHLFNVLQSKNLQVLNLTGCSKLQRFPDIPDKLKGLKELYLGGTSIEELPASIENLVSLEKLNLIECKKLANLPSSIYKLSNLNCLILSGCSKLKKIPIMEDLSDLHSKMGFPKLEILRLEGCNLLEGEFLKNHSCFPQLRVLHLSIHTFAMLPTCGHLHNLLDLHVWECGHLQEIDKIPGQLQRLSMNCESLSKIPSDMWVVNHIDKLLLIKQTHPRANYHILLLGGEMPQWLLPNKEGYISFMVSKDLYKKLLALAICVVYRVKEGKQNASYCLRLYVNGKYKQMEIKKLPLVHSEHVWLEYHGIEEVWGVDPFGPNNWSSFELGIGALGGVIVKKCGFRLICKSLEDDDLEALYQEEMLDPSLIYEIWRDDKETTTEEESHLAHKLWRFHEDDEISKEDHISSDSEDEILTLCFGDVVIDPMPNFPRNDIMANFLVERRRYSTISTFCRDILPGGDMLEEFILVEGCTISFMVSQDFYDKFLGLALCVVFSVDNGENEIFFDIVPHVDGQRRNGLSGSLGSFDLDHMWIQYLKSNVLWGMLEGAVDFLEFDRDCLRFSLTLSVSGGTVKKFGYVLRCKQMDDDLKVVLGDKELVNPASIYEMKFEEFFYKFLPRQMEELECLKEKSREEWKRRREEMKCQMGEMNASESSDNETD